MGKLDDMIAFRATVQAATTQLNSSPLIGDWFRLGVTAEEAIQWIGKGFTPKEAKPLIESGMTPELAAAGDPDTVEEAIARLADAGIDTTGADLSALDDNRS